MAIDLSGNGGRPQIIRGQTYSQYSPQWYEAMDQNRVDKGTNLGKTTKAAYDAMGNPADTSSSSGSGSLAGIGATIPRVGDSGGGDGGDWTRFDSPGGGGNAGHIGPIDMTAANAAAFGRAKDQVGQTTSGALTGLRSVLASRGMLGSGAESRGTVSAITKGMGELGDVSRANAINDVNVNLDVAKTNQASDIAQRGQDITKRGQNMDYSSTHRGQDITQRGQDISAENARMQMQYTKSLQEAAQRQQILQGILSTVGGGLY